MLIVVLTYLFMFFFFTLLGITILVLLKIDKRNYVLSPFFGISTTVIICQNLGLFMPGKYITLLLLGTLSILIVFLYKRVLSALKLFFTENRVIFAYFSIISFVSILPIMIMGGLTSFNSFNNDLIVYLTNPEWLNKFNYLSTPSYDAGFSITNYSTDLIKIKHERVGFDYLTLTLCNLTGLETFEVFGVFSALVFTLLATVVSVFCSNYFKLDKRTGIIVYLLLACSPLMFTVMFSQFTPQITGLTLLFLTMCLIVNYLEERKTANLLLISISISSVVAVYAEIIVYLIALLFCYLISIYRNNIKDFFASVYYLLLSGIVAFLIDIPAFIIMIYKQLSLMGLAGTNAGNVTFFAPISNYLALIFGFHPLLTANVSVVSSVITLLSLIFIVYGFIKIKQNKLFFIFSLIFGTVIFIYFKYIKLFPYGVYKHIIIMMPILLIIIGASISHISKNNKKITNLLITVLLMVNLYNVSIVQYRVLTKELKIDNNLIELKELKTIVPYNEAITLKVPDYGETHLASYFLRDSKLNLSSISYFGDFRTNNEESSYILSNNNNFQDIYINKDERIIWQNKKYQLVHSNSPMKVQFGNGFYEPEQNGLFRWMDKEGEVRIVSKTDKVATIQFDILGIVPTSKTNYKTVSVYLNDILLKEFVAYKDQINEVEIRDAAISKNENILRIVVEEGTNTVNNDPRNLSISLSNFQIKS